MRRLRRNIGDINRGGRSFSGLTRFNPTSLLGYVPSPYSIAELRGLGRLWQNTAKTTPAVADGDPVRVVECGGGVDYTAPTDAARPLLWAEAGSRWSLSFDGVDDYIAWSPSSPPVLTGCHSFVSGRVGSARSNGGISVSQTNIINDFETGGALFWNQGTTGSDFRFNGVLSGLDNRTLAGGVYQQVEFIAVVGGTHRAFAAGSPLGTSTDLISSITPTTYAIGCRLAPSPGFFSTVRISSVLLFSAPLNAANQTAVRNYVASITP